MCGLGCIPDEAGYEMTNERNHGLEGSKIRVTREQNVNLRELLNAKWLEREDGNMCFEMIFTINQKQ